MEKRSSDHNQKEEDGKLPGDLIESTNSTSACFLEYWIYFFGFDIFLNDISYLLPENRTSAGEYSTVKKQGLI